ncbi:hypothetical protein K9L16_02570 [Candidatus Pacearchaeota archaeon]|nr:hypothetical protein [Candidatus Pacearchaeota archaeon]
MKKIDKIFLGILGIEILLITILYVFFQNPCGSSCTNYGIFNPFGEVVESCIQVCVQTQHFLFYPVLDLFILTLVVYLIYFLIKMKGGN